MHGLIFKTSISLLAGSTRYLMYLKYTVHAGARRSAPAPRPIYILGRSSTGDLVRKPPCVRHDRTGPFQRESFAAVSTARPIYTVAPADCCRPHPGRVTAAHLCCLKLIQRGWHCKRRLLDVGPRSHWPSAASARSTRRSVRTGSSLLTRCAR